MPLAAIIAIALVAAVLVAVGIGYALGYLPSEGLRPLRASAAEAGERTSDLAAEFFEWLRSGR